MAIWSRRFDMEIRITCDRSCIRHNAAGCGARCGLAAPPLARVCGESFNKLVFLAMPEDVPQVMCHKQFKPIMLQNSENESALAHIAPFRQAIYSNPQFFRARFKTFCASERAFAAPSARTLFTYSKFAASSVRFFRASAK